MKTLIPALALAAALSASLLLAALLAGGFAFYDSYRSTNKLQDDLLRQIAAKLEKKGIFGAYEGALALSSSPETVSRTHIAEFLRQQGVEDGVGNLVGDLVRVTFGDGLGSKEVFAHGVLRHSAVNWIGLWVQKTGVFVATCCFLALPASWEAATL